MAKNDQGILFMFPSRRPRSGLHGLLKQLFWNTYEWDTESHQGARN